MYGHSSPIRSLSISPDDTLACSISKGSCKIWNVESRSCLRALPLASSRKTLYGLCSAFVPESVRVVVGTKEGGLMLIDYASGNVVSAIEKAHGGAIWSLDVTRKFVEETGENVVLVMTGSADGEVKIWEIEEEGEGESDEDEDEDEEKVRKDSLSSYLTSPHCYKISKLSLRPSSRQARHSFTRRR